MSSDPYLPSQVSLERGYLMYQSPYGHAWSVPVAAIALVGRVAVRLGGDGPESLIVIAFRDLSWHAIPTMTPGLPECLDILSGILGVRLASEDGEPEAHPNHVLWPPAMAGSPVFAARGERRSTTFPESLDSDSSGFTEQVTAFLSSGPVPMGGVA